MTSIAYYISGHGYGHAVRSSEVLRALAARRPGLRVHVRTSAPPELFRDLPAAQLRVDRVEVDSGVVELDGSLRIDPDETIARLKQFIGRLRPRIDAEVEFVRRERIALLVADIPFLAGFVAAESRVPCIAVANFTWDWIFEPMLAGDPQGPEILALTRSGYAYMTELLRLPFGHQTDVFARVTDVPLVAGRATRSEPQTLAALGIDPGDTRPRVLAARRGGFFWNTLRTAAVANPDHLILHLGDVAGRVPENVTAISRSSKLTFNDLLQVSDVLISKLGYATLAACVACGTRVLYPPRTGFREDEILPAAAQRLLGAQEISAADLESGRWGVGLRTLGQTVPPRFAMRLDGAEVCADLIADYAHHRRGKA